LAHQSYAQAGPYAEAFEHFLLLYEDPSGLQAALDYSDELEGQGRVTIAVVVRTVSFLAVGDATSFLAQLQLLKQFGTPLSMLIWTPLAARHRADPAMQVWIVDTGLDTLWRERGAPDLCRPAEDGWSCR
jgi:hypothetical protein